MRRTMVTLALAAAVAAVPAVAAQAEGQVKGVDASRYDATFDWGTPGVEFGFAKASEGERGTDPAFARHWREMRGNGLVRGAYHYGHPGTDPVREADHFLTVVRQQGLVQGDLLALDLEVADGRSVEQVNAWARRWLERVEQQTGVKPFFYSSWSFAGQYGEGLGEYPLWVAHYGKSKGEVEPPRPWREWVVHQYASTDHDWNVSRVSPQELRALGVKAPAPVSP
ncbi:glycoside hydrolase family 25 protein [Nonomuraea sp. NPDC050310]|uniref:glycoside hydrolase family 25 protein n=1 Tax=Nonomuraea sp. NPDC050310 TaxID=3154935 RepID=UPI0033ED4268